jgi:hypothetical protein
VNRRSLGFARDDKGYGGTSMEAGGRFSSRWVGLKTASAQQLLSMEWLPFPLSSRAKPRDLRFTGLVLEMFFNKA